MASKTASLSSQVSDVEKHNEENLNQNKVRSVYLVTYSQSDLSIFPTSEKFAKAVTTTFLGGKCKVLQWTCSMEKHKEEGVHYHLCIKLDKNMRWIGVKNEIKGLYNVTLNFSANHSNYHRACMEVHNKGK